MFERHGEVWLWWKARRETAIKSASVVFEPSIHKSPRKSPMESLSRDRQDHETSSSTLILDYDMEQCAPIGKTI